MAAMDLVDLETPYQYDRILSNKIRVLVLLAGDRDDDLWGYFETVSLEDRPVYKALSYAWGKPVFPHILHVVGGDIAISSTVQAALRRLRDLEDPVRLWIDAICINQKNTAEKNVQVEMMAHIYSEAEEVIVWLADEGEFDCHNHHMIQLLHQWYLQWFDWRRESLPVATLSEVIQGWERWVSVGKPAFQSCHGRISARPVTLAQSLKRLHSLWASPWFRRLWVIQEAVSASRLSLLYGNHKSDLPKLKRAADCIHFLTKFHELGYRFGPGNLAHKTLTHISSLRNALSSPEIITERSSNPTIGLGLLTSGVDARLGGRLLHNLVGCAALGASDEHDLIYAIRSISQIAETLAFKPDYSLSLVELWLRVARNIGEHSPEILLSLASARPPAIDGKLPSWTPEFPMLDEASYERYCSFGHSCRRTWKTHSGSMEFVEAPKKSSLELTSGDHSILRARGLCLFSIGSFDDGGNRARRFHIDNGEWPEMYLDLTSAQMLVRLRASRERQESFVIGSLPTASQVGDFVWLLQGCPLPFVLRRQDDGRHSLVGEVYSMDAELKRVPWPSGIEDVVMNVELI